MIPCSQSISITSHYRSIDIPFILDNPIVCHDFTNVSHETPLFWIICNIFFCPFSWEFHHPNWRTPSFFRGVGIPPTSIRPKFPCMGKSTIYKWQFSIANCKRLSGRVAQIPPKKIAGHEIRRMETPRAKLPRCLVRPARLHRRPARPPKRPARLHRPKNQRVAIPTAAMRRAVPWSSRVLRFEVVTGWWLRMVTLW